MSDHEGRYRVDEGEHGYYYIVDQHKGRKLPFENKMQAYMQTICDLLNTQAARIARLEAALEGLFNRHATLVLSGDCGEWDVMNEPEVEQARAVLAEREVKP